MDVNDIDYSKLSIDSYNSMFSHSQQFLNVLSKTIKQDYLCFAIYNDNEILGCLPSFLYKNTKYGNILNSLPYYGMHGGIITSNKLKEEEIVQIKNILLNEFKKFAVENECISSSIITTPFERHDNIYVNTLNPEHIEKKRAQITRLPESDINIEEKIFSVIESRCKRAVKKSRKYGVQILNEFNEIYLNDLYKMHEERMNYLSGNHKDLTFFKLVIDLMKENVDYSFRVALKDDKAIGALLLFYYKHYVEYFTPIFDINYSEYQPNSLLIFEGMKDAIKKGYSLWNFGGTGWSMDSLYLYKRSWGAIEHIYHNYVNFYEGIEHIYELSPDNIVKEYPNFYTIPFKLLKG